MKVHKCGNFLIAINFNDIKKQRKLLNYQKPSKCIHIHINSLFFKKNQFNLEGSQPSGHQEACSTLCESTKAPASEPEGWAEELAAIAGQTSWSGTSETSGTVERPQTGVGAAAESGERKAAAEAEERKAGAESGERKAVAEPEEAKAAAEAEERKAGAESGERKAVAEPEEPKAAAQPEE